MRVVLDSNIYISALISGGLPLLLIQKLTEDAESQIFFSEAIFDETTHVLRDKFKWPEDDIQEAEALITGSGQRVVPSQTADVVRDDPSDNRILECALEAGAEYVITGDRHLLRLGRYGNARVAKVAEFLSLGKELEG